MSGLVMVVRLPLSCKRGDVGVHWLNALGEPRLDEVGSCFCFCLCRNYTSSLKQWTQPWVNDSERTWSVWVFSTVSCTLNVLYRRKAEFSACQCVCVCRAGGVCSVFSLMAWLEGNCKLNGVTWLEQCILCEHQAFDSLNLQWNVTHTQHIQFTHMCLAHTRTHTHLASWLSAVTF